MQGSSKGWQIFMNEKIEKQKDLFCRLDVLWDKTESLILRFFDDYLATEDHDPHALPKMTDFNIVTAAIKRLQEARIALLKEEFQDESLNRANEPDSKSAEEEISRILEALEKNGDGETPDPDEMPDGS